jgi:hypothetical protein
MTYSRDSPANITDCIVTDEIIIFVMNPTRLPDGSPRSPEFLISDVARLWGKRFERRAKLRGRPCHNARSTTKRLCG